VAQDVARGLEECGWRLGGGDGVHREVQYNPYPTSKAALPMASLLKQNPWLRDPKIRAKALRISAATSSAVEGIRKPYADLKKSIKPVQNKKKKSA
jgi:hypothetical protein